MASVEQVEENVYCKNCKREVSLANFVTHEAHCLRNIVLCDICNEPSNKSEINTHMEENHVSINCEKCYRKMERYKLAEHQESECPYRIVTCKYCEIESPIQEMNDHEMYCGSRTEKCQTCGKNILVKNQKDHEDMCGKSPVENLHKPLNKFPRVSDVQNGAKPKISPTSRRNNALFEKKPLNTDVSVQTMNKCVDRDEDRRVEHHRGYRAPPSRPGFTAFQAKSLSTVRNISKPSQRSFDKDSDRSQRFNVDSMRDVGMGDMVKDTGAISKKSPMTGFNQISQILSQGSGKSYLGSSPEDNVSWDSSLSTTFTPSRPLLRFPVEEPQVMLPCEFCEAMFPEEDLIQHESGCRPDIAHKIPEKVKDDEPVPIHPSEKNNESSFTVLEGLSHEVVIPVNSAITRTILPISGLSDDDNDKETNDSTEKKPVELPCEFCGSPFDVFKLENHQIICDMNPRAFYHLPSLPTAELSRAQEKWQKKKEKMINSDVEERRQNLHQRFEKEVTKKCINPLRPEVPVVDTTAGTVTEDELQKFIKRVNISCENENILLNTEDQQENNDSLISGLLNEVTSCRPKVELSVEERRRQRHVEMLTNVEEEEFQSSFIPSGRNMQEKHLVYEVDENELSQSQPYNLWGDQNRVPRAPPRHRYSSTGAVPKKKI